MSVEENLRVIDSMYDALNTRDWDRFNADLSESAFMQSVESPEPYKGRDAIREDLQTVVAAFPDVKFEKVRSFGQGDTVAAELILAGTHKGPLPGPGGEAIPATNKPVRFQYSVVFKLEGGMITEIHRYYDQLGFLVQLGLAP